MTAAMRSRIAAAQLRERAEERATANTMFIVRASIPAIVSASTYSGGYQCAGGHP